MSTIIGIVIGLVAAAALYVWKSGDKPAKAARSIFVSSDAHSDEN